MSYLADRLSLLGAPKEVDMKGIRETNREKENERKLGNHLGNKPEKAKY